MHHKPLIQSNTSLSWWMCWCLFSFAGICCHGNLLFCMYVSAIWVTLLIWGSAERRPALGSHSLWFHYEFLMARVQYVAFMGDHGIVCIDFQSLWMCLTWRGWRSALSHFWSSSSQLDLLENVDSGIYFRNAYVSFLWWHL